MSLMQPSIDELLDKTDNDKFLLCAVASERARDINDMMRGQRDRAKVLNSANQIAQLAGRKPLSLALEEIERDEISYDKNEFSYFDNEEDAPTGSTGGDEQDLSDVFDAQLDSNLDIVFDASPETPSDAQADPLLDVDLEISLDAGPGVLSDAILGTESDIE